MNRVELLVGKHGEAAVPKEAGDYIPEALEKVERFLSGVFPEQLPQPVQQRLNLLKADGRVIVSDESLRAKQIEHGENPELLEFTAGMHDLETDSILLPKRARLGTIIHEMFHFISYSPRPDEQGRIFRSGFRYVDAAGKLNNNFFNEAVTVMLAKMAKGGINVSRMMQWKPEDRFDYFIREITFPNTTSFGGDEELNFLGQSYKEALQKFAFNSGVERVIGPLSQTYFLTQAENGEKIIRKSTWRGFQPERLEHLEPYKALGFYTNLFDEPSRQLMNRFRYPKKYQELSKMFRAVILSAILDRDHSGPLPVHMEYPENQSKLISFRIVDDKVTVRLLGDNSYDARLNKLIECKEAVKPLILWEGHRVTQAIETHKVDDERQIFSYPIVADYLQHRVKADKLFKVVRYLSHVLNIHLKPEEVGSLTMEFGGEKAWEAYEQWSTSFHFNDFNL